MYASGDNSGVACVNRETGDVIWKSVDNADRVIGANKEFVYIRDRQGRFHVFDAKRATDAAGKKSAPLGSIDLNEFNVNIVNTANVPAMIGSFIPGSPFSGLVIHSLVRAADM